MNINQNVNVQFVYRYFGHLSLQNANVQFVQPRKPQRSEMERFKMYFYILIAILCYISMISLHFCILLPDLAGTRLTDRALIHRSDGRDKQWEAIQLKIQLSTRKKSCCFINEATAFLKFHTIYDAGPGRLMLFI
ncbi:hypothetical protein [Paenibacillus sp. NPDC058174]|uniref:hypothetical protein n=1 Tax=Paenibacillus sp. NPDC058174 TaxID=3346366 RepID=UPI0036DA497E